MKKSLDHAVNMHLIDANPIHGIYLPKSIPYKAKFLTLNEAKRLLEVSEGSNIETAIFLTIHYGFRRGEALGLRWQDINFNDNYITVQNTRTRVKKVIEKSPKNKSSIRRLYLMPTVKAYLKNLIIKQKEDKLKLGSLYEANDYVCKTGIGHPIDTTYLSHMFKKIIKDNNLPDIRFHDLRHTTASYLNHLGNSAKDIQEWLGHSNISTTMDTYVHQFGEANREMALGLDKFLKDVYKS